MENYKPPFSITNEMLELTASISEKVGRISSRKELETRPHLRRNNRIESIHASLKIEANSLSISEVRDIIDGHAVLGNSDEIKEVKNAYNAYEQLDSLDPFKIEDLKKAHAIMTGGLLKESGVFRSGNEGVFANGKCIFVAPPPDLVPELMENLFDWMKEASSTLHPLILSAVFHYEFVFIHPFSDGNGRIARLWHTLLLYKWREIFAYIPIESQIEKFQESYYEAISKCHINGDSTIFIEFMLNQIDRILDDLILRFGRENGATTEYVKRMLSVMEFGIPYTANSIMEKLGLKSKETFRKNYMNPAIAQGFVKMSIPDKPNSRNQSYIKIG